MKTVQGQTGLINGWKEKLIRSNLPLKFSLFKLKTFDFVLNKNWSFI